MSEIYLAITIDTECDKGPGWRIRRPMTFHSVTHGVTHRLEPLFRELGSPATYLLSPEVMRDPASVEALLDAHRHGAELGTHLHGEFIDPQSDPEAPLTNMMQNMYSHEVEAAKLAELTRLFDEKFGFRPTSFRAGRFGIGKHSLTILSELGYTVDSSVVPFTEFRDKGGAVAFLGSPVLPYYPSRRDFLRHGDLPILEIPVTTGDTLWSSIPAPLLKTVPRFPRLWGVPHKMFKQQFKTIWLRPTWSSVEQMKRVFDEAVRRAGGAPAFLVMMFHNVEVEPALSPYAQDEHGVADYMARLRGILEYAASRGTHFTTLSAMRPFFEKRNIRHRAIRSGVTAE
jgi:peptidoglycan/xylan/chitin deacetylase (PgdA/CDA1 family)